MPSTASSSSVQAARERLGDQLRELRAEAGFSGIEFARSAGWADSSLVSMIERGRRTITVDHVRTWCRICGASERRSAELLAEQRAVLHMWETHKEATRAGLKRVQESVREKYERVRVHRVYQTKVIPGLLQTEALTTAYLAQARVEQHVAVDDVAKAVAERMARQHVLRRPGKRFLFVVEEDVLWYRPFAPEIQAEQLRHLLEEIRLPTVSFGVIPRIADRRGVSPDESFTMTETDIVSVELVSGYLTITQPYEIGMYFEAWERLSALAVHGRPAREVITTALADLEGRS
ncbi:helix-turn-helix domain-containing protein [Actinomadura sp. 9N215]|uniref:helix-turn-helix domain-containing protein n=1 Tax=Actinomadura sp. 9N215 TaxID=3375150 RepID=UPI00378EE3FE